MAKDPALLWYFNDWHGGTSTMSRFLKGCYMDLLHAQFNTGHLSLEEIKTVLGSDFGSSWSALQKKFIQDSNGLYYQPRLETEHSKRKNFSESRRKNASSEKHMHEHMENENENRIVNKDEFLIYCKEILKEKFDSYKFSLEAKYDSWIENKWKDGNGIKIKNWKTKIRNTIPFLKPEHISFQPPPPKYEKAKEIDYEAQTKRLLALSKK